MSEPHLQIPALREGEAVSITQDLGAQLQANQDRVAQQVVEAFRALSKHAEPLRPLIDFSSQEKFACDSRTDSVFGHANQVLQSIRIAYLAFEHILSPEQKKHLELIEYLLEVTFPQGTAYLNDTRRQQHGISENMLKRLQQPEPQNALNNFPLLEQLFLYLGSVHEEFTKVMGFNEEHQPEGPSPIQVWEEHFELYVIAIRFLHKDDPELRKSLLAPYTEFLLEQERMRKRKRRKRAQKESEDTNGNASEPKDS
ncbi:MAG: hypothetical protein AAGJ35_01000 [Myxococcota bacterium]